MNAKHGTVAKLMLKVAYMRMASVAIGENARQAISKYIFNRSAVHA